MRTSSIGSWTSRFPRLGSRPGRRWAGVAGTVMGLTLLVGGAALADPPTLITQGMLPYTITQPGSYQFAENLSGVGGDAITVAVGNVDLNGAGYTLDGQGSGRYGIYVGAVSGVRIQNVTVTGFANGSFVDGGDNIVLVGNTTRDNEHGMQVRASSSTLIGNTASHNHQVGIFVNGSGNVVTGNTAEDNGSSGIFLGSGATGNLVRGNTTRYNGQAGIDVTGGAAGNRIQGNLALSNGIRDLLDGIGDCNHNTWLGNTFGSKFPDCIQ